MQLELLRDRLREKDDALEKKSKQLACLQMDRKRLETELSQVSDQTSSSDRQLGLLKRKVKVIRILITFQKRILYFMLCPSKIVERSM